MPTATWHNGVQRYEQLALAPSCILVAFYLL